MGGSFNPAHGGHRRMAVAALERLHLDAVWWLVSPGNPLKPAKGMAPLAERLASARRIARHPRIIPTAIEAELGTRYTADTLRALVRRYPNTRFIWLMGADNLGQFHLWRDWRAIARLVPIAVFPRRPYIGSSHRAPAAAWLRPPRRDPARWKEWRLPAHAHLNVPLDARSATAIRASRGKE
jgi:nicotinate-nucleotide adenylyltransferase